MCTITISPAYNASPGAPGHTLVSLEGTYICTSDIDVTITCAGATSQTTAAVKINSTMWIAEVDVPNCPCGSPATITATCHDLPPCTATLNTALMCNCCPQITTVANQGPWTSSGQSLITFVTTLTFPAGCSVTVQRDFGDGNMGTPQTFTSSPATYQETHPYNPTHIYTSNLNVLSNAFCGASSGQITVLSAPPCATQPWLGILCRLFQSLFVLFGAVAGAIFFASISPACLAANPLPIATGSAVTAVLILAFLQLFCRKCVCQFLSKLIGQMFVAIGMVLVMFVIPPNCFGPPIVALGAAVLSVFFGAALVLNGAWYQPNITVCPLTICNYWRAVTEGLIAAFIAAIIVFISLGSAVPVWPNLFVALAAIAIFMILSNLQEQLNQSAGNC
jgi:hypothetical protein